MAEVKKLYDVSDINPDTWRVPSRDEKGHDVRAQFRAQPALVSAIQTVVYSKKFPLRNPGDFWRFAAIRLLHYLASFGDESLRSVTGQVDAINAIMADDEFHSEFRSVFDKLRERVTRHSMEGDTAQAKKLVYTILQKINQMPEGFWKDKYVAEIKASFKEFLVVGETASFTDFDKEGK